MIDTITYNIHLYRSNIQTLDFEGNLIEVSIFQNLINSINEIMKGTEIYQIDRSNLVGLKKNSLIEIKANGITGDFNLCYKFDKVMLPSYKSGVNLQFDNLNGILRVELSLPKYYFGNNVLELSPIIKSRFYSYSLDLQKLSTFIHTLIKKSIRNIIYELSGQTLIIKTSHFCDISVSRIDFTYNQIFDNTSKLLHYLDCIKECKPLEFKNNHPTDYHSGVAYVTDNYGFKIYHKGVEFEKIQSKQIIKDNYHIMKHREREDITYFSSNKFLTFKNLNNLQKYSNNCLRYELRSSSKNKSYIFFSQMAFKHNELYQSVKHNLFWIFGKEWDPIANYEYNIYKYEVCDLVIIKAGYYYKKNFTENKLQLIRIDNPKMIKRLETFYKHYNGISKILSSLQYDYSYKNLQSLYKVYTKLETQKIDFFLGKPKDFQDRLYSWYGSENILIPKIETSQYYEPYLIKCQLVEFIKLFYKFQISKLTTDADIVKNASEYNEKINLFGGKKMNLNKVRQYRLLLKKFTLKDLKNKKIMSEATYYRVKKSMQILNQSNNDNYSIKDFSGVDRTFDFPFRKQNHLNINKKFKRIY